MSAPVALVVGAGRMAGGFLAPLLRDAGWDVVLAGRTPAVVAAVNEHRGVRVRLAGAGGGERWIGGVRAIRLDGVDLPRLVLECDLLATAVGASALPSVGELLAPALRLRMAHGRPLNVLALENHRRAGELLVRGLLARCPALAPALGRSLGVAGVAAWRAVVRRTLDRDGVAYDGDATTDCFADARSLVAGAAPLIQDVPGLTLVDAFDERMLEKLWLFNGGHAAAAYLGRLRGHATVDAAMADAEVAATVAGVVAESRRALSLVRRPWSPPAPHVDVAAVLARYASPTLGDSVMRVGRDPRRKLGAGDRLLGPALACAGAGIEPVALVEAAAAALAYDAPRDVEAATLQSELALVGPEETLAGVAALDRRDELVHAVGAAYRRQARSRAAA